MMHLLGPPSVHFGQALTQLYVHIWRFFCCSSRLNTDFWIFWPQNRLFILTFDRFYQRLWADYALARLSTDFCIFGPQRNASICKGNTPICKGNTSIYKGDPPVYKGNPPDCKGNAPICKGNQPICKGNPPVYKGKPPVCKGNAPICKRTFATFDTGVALFVSHMRPCNRSPFTE